MSRWRPPTKQGSPYITAEGYAALEAEVVEIWRRRRDVVKHLAAAAAEGDRSENAEYIYRKRELAGIDRRIRYLQRRMPTLKVVTEVPAERDRIFFGATVEVEGEDGSTAVYRIVGSDEIDAARGWISIDAPMARALLKCAVDDEVTLMSAAGARRFVVVAVAYADFSGDPAEP